MSDEGAEALRHWGLSDAPTEMVAARENRIYRVGAPDGPLALRLRRPGLRSLPEIVSELAWMDRLAAEGMRLPRPVPTSDGALCVETSGTIADVVTWIDGKPMGRDGVLTASAAAFGALGHELARLHILCDDWQPPPAFIRHAWDAAGLVGDRPVWGRFWENPLLNVAQADLLARARSIAADMLDDLGTRDYGLIHADAVPENVMLAGGEMALIDFDDGGFGHRLFDLATVVNRADRDDPSGTNSAAFLTGYTAARPIDLGMLPLFCALRSFTYVGWIADRLDEPGNETRVARMIDDALTHARRLCEGAAQ